MVSQSSKESIRGKEIRLTELKAVLNLEKYSGDRSQFGKFRDDLEEAICGTHQAWRGLLDYIGKTPGELSSDVYHAYRTANVSLTMKDTCAM